VAVPPQVTKGELGVKVPDLVSNTIILITPSGKATVNIYLHEDVKFHKIYSSYTTPLYNIRSWACFLLQLVRSRAGHGGRWPGGDHG